MDREQLEHHARGLYLLHAPRIAELIGARGLPSIEVEVLERMDFPAATSGNRVLINLGYFATVRDIGALIHEFVHLIMNAPVYDEGNSWLVEGIADYVRDILGFREPWSREHYEVGGALRGFQTTAHFLLFLESKYPGIVLQLSRKLMEGRYYDEFFKTYSGKTIDQLVREYDERYSAFGST